MKKQLKKVLFITDDLEDAGKKLIKERCEQGNVYFHQKDNYLKFKFDIVNFKTMDNRKRYDVVLVDYGLLGTRRVIRKRICGPEYNIKILQRFYLQNTPIAWVGGLSWRQYNTHARKEFPKHKFIHNLYGSNLGNENILLLLYDLL